MMWRFSLLLLPSSYGFMAISRCNPTPNWPPGQRRQHGRNPPPIGLGKEGDLYHQRFLLFLPSLSLSLWGLVWSLVGWLGVEKALGTLLLSLVYRFGQIEWKEERERNVGQQQQCNSETCDRNGPTTRRKEPTHSRESFNFWSRREGERERESEN